MRGASPVDHKLGGNHISGGECITSEKEIKEATFSLINRALNHVNGKCDFINISIQKIQNPEEISYVKPLPITTLDKNINKLYPNMILEKLGFKKCTASKILEKLLSLKNLKGAAIIPIEDFENFKWEIVRCTNMDYHQDIKHSLDKFLKKNNFSEKLKDALCLSTKICENENVLCEICLSDDKGYSTGYIASKKLGYIRIENFKPEGHDYGGRIIFVKDKRKKDLTINYLKNSVVIVNSLPKINDSTWWLNV